MAFLEKPDMIEIVGLFAVVFPFSFWLFSDTLDIWIRLELESVNATAITRIRDCESGSYGEGTEGGRYLSQELSKIPFWDIR